LAGTGVFGKQTPGPGHCGPLTLPGKSRSRYTGRPFSRSYGANLPSSLTAGLSSTSVCSTSPPVSVCGTVTPHLARGFSRRFVLNAFGVGLPPCLTLPSQVKRRAGFAWHDSLPGWRRLRARDLAPRVPPSLITVVRGTGILTRCPSPTALALGLGPPHPQLISMAAEPLGIRWGGFAPPSRYSCRHSHSPPLHLGSRLGFSADGDAPLPCKLALTSAASVTGLSPGGLSAPRHSRPVSYYALFQGWLLLSQPPGCLRAATTLPTEPVVRDLSRRSGLFPSRRRIFAPAVSHPPPAWSSKLDQNPRHSSFGSGR
jgi:hypothetical protein